MTHHPKDGCAHCGEFPVVLTQKCHPDANTMTLLNEDGSVVVICAECESFIINFQSDLMEDDHENVSGRDIH